MTPPSKRFELLLKWIFGSPWITSIFLALLGTASAWLLLRGNALFPWRKLAIGAVLGVFVGALFSVETHFPWDARVKFIISGLIGLLLGVVVAILLQFGVAQIIVAALAGLALGVTSKYWLFHVNLP
ncbi:hypothetical protein GO998_07635 [Ralstonia syzygii]|uniref:Transmembrane protein n=1 Tax=Ralstonia syzygii TaxID=28097 RepID=A0ABX7ZE80_9RALS|nr:hypothetical protein [Ralstonia syzygii]QUP53641.1 hypothetical protein GO998_07635 [Ralstonia syzygii]